MSDRLLNPLDVYDSIADYGDSLIKESGMNEGQWTPSADWNMDIPYLENPADIHSPHESYISGVNAAMMAQAPKISSSVEMFCRMDFIVPPALLGKAVEMHPMIGNARGLIMLVDESANPGRGIELVWVERGVVIQAPLGIKGNVSMIAKKVTNVRVSPGGNHLAMLVEVNRDGNAADEHIRFHCPKIPEGALIKPQGESGVLIVDLLRNSDGGPLDVRVYNYSEMFLPEYGFDLVWCASVANAVPDLVFVAMLHTEQGARAYLVRWANFRDTSSGSFVSTASLNEVSLVFEHDKIHAVWEQESTLVTSRVELSENGHSVFFDTMSKSGVIMFGRDMLFSHGHVTIFNADYRFTINDIPTGNLSGFASSRVEDWSNFPQISRMSPDGSLFCTLVSLPVDCSAGRQKQVVNMISVSTGATVFSTFLGTGWSSPHWSTAQYDKHDELATGVIGFSSDSSLFWVRPSVLTKIGCWIDNACVPAVFDARSGRMIQDFGRIAHTYLSMQMDPNALIVYGTRPTDGASAIDVIDVINGNILKTVDMPGVFPFPGQFEGACSIQTSSSTVTTVARGDMELMYESTRAAVGFKWEH